ncbi:MAG TPA: pilus assembly protein N-terminal domain-containing protein [Pirellulaceae bacterium]|nr:pilus assembly protein N-terminal domain-containing protein [Pirellulaceae bacterium]
MGRRSGDSVKAAGRKWIRSIALAGFLGVAGAGNGLSTTAGEPENGAEQVQQRRQTLAATYRVFGLVQPRKIGGIAAGELQPVKQCLALEPVPDESHTVRSRRIVHLAAPQADDDSADSRSSQFVSQTGGETSDDAVTASVSAGATDSADASSRDSDEPTRGGQTGESGSAGGGSIADEDASPSGSSAQIADESESAGRAPRRIMASRPEELFDVMPEAGEVKLSMRQSKLLRLRVDLFRTAVVDPTVCDVVQFSPREICLMGKSAGTTNVTFWIGDGEPRPLTYRVTVEPDRRVRQQLEREYRDFEKLISELFPNSNVQLMLVADKVIVKGRARDSEEASRILAVLRHSNADNNSHYVATGIGSADSGPDAGGDIVTIVVKMHLDCN